MDPQAEALIQRLRTQPDNVEAYEALKSHYHFANDFASLANLVEGWAGRQSDARTSADAFHEAARTVSYYLEDQHRAADLLENALDRAPDHTEAGADLERLLEALSETQANVRSLERRARRFAAADADPIAIAAIHYQLGELWEKSLERPEQAVVHYRSAFELDPEHLPAMYATRELYRKSGDLRSAAQVYELEISAEPEASRKVMLLRELAHLEHEGLSDLDASIRALGRALEHMPHDREVTYELAGGLLGRAASRGDAPESLDDRRQAAAMLVRLSHGADGETQVAFLESALDAAPDHDEALTTLEQIAAAARAEDRLPLRWIRYIGLAPDGPNAAARRTKLADAYEAAGQTSDAIACLEPLLAAGDPALVKRLTDLYTREGRTADAARLRDLAFASLAPADRIVTYEQALTAAAPASDEAMQAIDSLLAINPAHANALAARLVSLRARNDHARLRDVLLATADDSAAPAKARASAYRELATLCDGPLADPELALRARAQLVSLSPGDRDERAKLKQSMRLGQRWDELAGILVWEASNDDDIGARRNAALSLDELTERASLEPARAIEALEAVHRETPDDATLRDRLLTRLLAVARHRDALPLIESKAEATAAAPEKMSLFDQAASIREELGDLVGAIGALERWIELDPRADTPARRALELAERSGDAKQVARAVSREAGRSTGDERARWLMRLADIESQQLGSDDRAIEALTLATQAAENDERVRIELEAALRRTGRFEALRDSLRGRAPKQPTDDDRVAIYLEVARLSEVELHDRSGASQAYRDLRAVREDRGALDWLVEDARTRADGNELVSLLGARYEANPEPGARTTTGLELATLLDRDEAQGGNRPRARAMLESLRGIAPDPIPVLEHLAKMCQAESDSAGLGSAWSDLLDHVTDPRVAVELARSLHALATGPLESEALAAKALANWSSLAPSERAPLEALVQLHDRAGRPRDAADALLELGKRMDSPSEAEAKLLEASDRYETAGDLEASMEAARLARSLGFASLKARVRLGIVAERAGRFDVVLEVAEARAADAANRGAGGRADVINELLTCASIAREKLHNPKRAEAYLLRASELAEGDPDAVARVESVANAIDVAANDGGASLERALVARLVERARNEEGAARVARIERAAKILASAIGDFDAAFNMLVEATAEDADPTLLSSLVGVAVAGAKVGELERLLKQRFEDSVDGDSARTLLETQAALYDRVNRASDAADVLQRLLGMRATVELRDRVLDALSRAGRHKDRVNVLEQSIRRAPADSEERNELGRRVARIWESELANKFEATDAWKRVARWTPHDAEAGSALERLGGRRPSLMPMPKPAAAAVAPVTPSATSAAPEGAPVRRSAPMPPPPPQGRISATPPPPPPQGRISAIPPPPPVPSFAEVSTRSLEASAYATADELVTTPPPPMHDAAMQLAHTDDVEEIDDAEAIDELDAVDAIDEPDHVRSHVSLPPPPPPPRNR
jgi:tetratricopeptide (TPR) repeat protein